MPVPQTAEPKDVDAKLLVIRKKTHWAIKKMADDINDTKFNTAISAAMELVNEIYSLLSESDKAFATPQGEFVIREALGSLTLCLSPFAPHFSEELWSELGHKTLASVQLFPKHNPIFLQNETFLLIIQVNGKVREKLEIQKGLAKNEIELLVLTNPKIQALIVGKSIRQFVYVPDRIANVVLAN